MLRIYLIYNGPRHNVHLGQGCLSGKSILIPIGLNVTQSLPGIECGKLSNRSLYIGD